MNSYHLPADSEVVVAGAGIIGLTTALYLSDRGVRVTICDKGTVGCEQSTRNWGWVRRMGRDPIEIPLAKESARLWETLAGHIGQDVGFRKTGIFYLCKSQKDLVKYEAWVPHAKAHDLDSHMLSAQQLQTYLPSLSGEWSGAMFTPSDARAEPSLATPAIAAELRRRGISIIENCAVRGIETTSGKITAAVTERGTIACGNFVLATGAWTRLFCRNIGIDFPQLRVFGSVLRTGPVNGAPEYAVAGNDFAFRKRLDGGYTVAQKNANIAQIVPDSFLLMRQFMPAFRSEGNEVRLRFGKAFFEDLMTKKRWTSSDATPFETERQLNPKPDQKILAEGLRNLTRSFPAFAGAEVLESWGCAIDVTPDAIPVISEVPSLPGLIIASGFSGHGFGIGPGAGHLIADIITGSNPIVDPLPYRLSRIVRT